MNLKINFYTVFFTLIVGYGIFQYGRVYDRSPKTIVDQPEYNHVVFRSNECTIVTDTAGNVNSIWFKDQPYTLDTAILNDL